MVAYASLALLKTHMGIGDTTDDALLQKALDTATLWIDQYTGRSFAGETGATKYFYPTNSRYLDLTPDIRTVTSVAVDEDGDLTFGDVFASTDYLLTPLNPEPDAGIYSRLEIAPLSGKSFLGRRQVRVVGNWGYTVGGVAPANIEYACLLQATRLFRRRDAPFGILQTTDLGQFTRISAMDADVKNLLDPYKSGVKAWVIV